MSKFIGFCVFIFSSIISFSYAYAGNSLKDICDKLGGDLIENTHISVLVETSSWPEPELGASLQIKINDTYYGMDYDHNVGNFYTNTSNMTELARVLWHDNLPGDYCVKTGMVLVLASVKK